MSERGRVAVVGGGLAGIAAALDCAAAGAAVTLLEVRPRLGGAAYSFEREGLSVDNGQHVFLRCCTEYRALLTQLGAAGDVTMQERLDVPIVRPDGRRARLRRSAAPAPLHLAGSLARFGLLSVGERIGVARAMLALRRVDPDDPRAEERAFGDWLAEQRQSPATVEAIWRLIVRPTINLEPAEASLAQVAQVFRTGLLEHADAGDIGWARVPLSDLHDAPAQRTLAAAGVDLRLRWRVERVARGEHAGFVVEGGEEPVEADAAIVAVPHDRAAALLPDEAGVSADKLARLGSSPIVDVHVHYDRRVVDEPFLAGVRTPVQFVFDRTASSGAGEGQYLAVSLSAADDEPAALGERTVAALGDLFPRAREARVLRCFTTREHAATFRAGPGARTYRPGPRTALAGLALAGSWTDTGWPATMESAVRSGRAAARVALSAPASVPSPARVSV